MCPGHQPSAGRGPVAVAAPRHVCPLPGRDGPGTGLSGKRSNANIWLDMETHGAGQDVVALGAVCEQI